MRVADVYHNHLRAARVDVGVRVDHLNVDRIATEPEIRLRRTRGAGEAGVAHVLPRLDVGRRQLEVVFVVRVDVVGGKYVADV